MLIITRQNHLAVFDSKHSYISSYIFQLIGSQSKQKNEKTDMLLKIELKNENEDVQLDIKNEYNVTFFIQNQFKYQWQSEIFDLQVQNSQINSFGTMPFSLQTFLEIYKNPQHWNIILRPKSDQIQTSAILKKPIGKLIIKSKFTKNPFIVPIQCLTQSLQCQKTIKVIKQDIQNQQILCSAQLVSIQNAIVDKNTYVPQTNKPMPQNFTIYTFKANQNVSSQHICIIKGIFEHKQLDYHNKKIHIYSGNKKSISFIPNLQRIMKMLKFIDNNIIILQNIQTTIQDSYRLIFYTDLPTLYAKIFRSFLYARIYDQWLIQGMVHYSRQNKHFQDIIQELTELISQGEELFPLCNSQYSFDHVWKIKAKFIYHVLANLSDSDLTRRIIMEFQKKKKKLTSAMIFKRLKNDIGKDRMKTIYEQQFINSTGLNRIFYQMEHQKREHKIKITLRQRSLVCGVFRRYNRIRIKLQQNYGLVSPIMQRIIKKNQGKRNQMSGPLAVPKFLKCIPYFVGPVNIQIQNSQPFQQQLQQQNIFQKIIDAKANLRVRRVAGKKSQQDCSDTISWMMMDTSMTFPAVYKGKNLNQSVIQSLIKKSYQNQIQQLKVLNSISIKDHSQIPSICKLLIQKIKIKPNKQNSKISVKRKILQILPNFISKANQIIIWDQILQLLQLYQPVCYDYSQQGNLFLISLIQSIGNITYNIKYNIYLQQFHRIFLSITRYHHCCINQQKFQFLYKQLFKSMTKWISKYSLQILEQAKKYLQLTKINSLLYVSLNKIIIQNILPYIDKLKINQNNLRVGKQIRQLVNQHIALDKTGTIRSVLFHYHTKINQQNYPALKFLDLTFGQLQKIKQFQYIAYDKCLEKFKQILNANRYRYAQEIQIQALNENQNYFLAEYLWKNMCSTQSLYNARVRLIWMKIYRIFYFYFTPIITMVKLNKNITTNQLLVNKQETFQILDNVMDFNADIKWFSVYDSSGSKKKKPQKKKQIQQYNFQDKDRNMFTDYIIKNPGKDTPEQLTKYALYYLIREYENLQITSSGLDKYKKIIEGLKNINQLLKRSNLRTIATFYQIPQKVYNLLSDFNEDDTRPRQVFDALTDAIQNLRRQRRQKQMQKNGDMRISLHSFDFGRLQSIKQQHYE